MSHGPRLRAPHWKPDRLGSKCPNGDNPAEQHLADDYDLRQTRVQDRKRQDHPVIVVASSFSLADIDAVGSTIK
jgi:hypothetical protein